MQLIFFEIYSSIIQSDIHLGKVTPDQTFIPSYPTPHQLCLSRNKRTNIEGFPLPGATGPYMQWSYVYKVQMG